MLEAMATGLPVLATTHGGIPEAVTHERTGLLVPERDEAALFRAMCQITAETDQLYILGQAASRAVRAWATNPTLSGIVWVSRVSLACMSTASNRNRLQTCRPPHISRAAARRCE